MTPIGWELAQINKLYEPFRDDLLLAVFRAKNRFNLDVRMISGFRSNTKQRGLYRAYLANLELFKAGKLATKPLQAAPPGHSAHNFVFCSTHESHNACAAETVCPVCGDPIVPASLAADLQLLSPSGMVIRCGGAVPLVRRPKEWQQWAEVLVEFNVSLRDGGTFSSPDPVHTEWAFWNYQTHKLLGITEP